MSTRHRFVAIFFIIAVAILVLSVWLPLVQTARIVLGSVFLFLLPGLAWTYGLWPDQYPLAERLIVACLLSIVGMPIVIFLLNRAGLPVTGVSIVVETAIVTLVGIGTSVSAMRHNREPKPPAQNRPTQPHNQVRGRFARSE